MPDEGGFAGSGRAYECDHFSPFECQIDIPERLGFPLNVLLGSEISIADMGLPARLESQDRADYRLEACLFCESAVKIFLRVGVGGVTANNAVTAVSRVDRPGLRRHWTGLSRRFAGNRFATYAGGCALMHSGGMQSRTGGLGGIRHIIKDIQDVDLIGTAEQQPRQRLCRDAIVF